MIERFPRLLPIAFLLLTACGGGGSGPSDPPAVSNPPAPPPPAVGTSYVKLSSDNGDFIGAGQEYGYSKTNAQITVVSEGAYLAITVEGDELWMGDFQLPDTYSELQQGSYPDLERYPFHDPAVGGLSWGGEGRGCNNLTGWIIIDSVTYAGATLTGIELQFEQHCEGAAAALHGEIHWDADDATSPPGPIVPPPAGLWQPAAGTTPSTGNYVYLQSQPGDFIGGGGDYLYSEADSVITVHAANGHLSVSVDGNEGWGGDFQVMNALSGLEVGYYGDLQRFPFHNPVKGGLSWSGEGRGCNRLTGWFVVDSVTYDGSTVIGIDLRFEQHCEGVAPALRGEIHWDVNDTTNPPGPVVPPPAGLWKPAAGITPDAGNYVYLESQAGDYVGGGSSYLYTLADSQITAVTTGARLDVSIKGDERWDGRFQGMNTLSRLEAGYYGDLQRYPFHNPVKGGLDWSGESRGCNTLTGWFVVDSVTYDGLTLTAIDLRFEQHCEGGAPALRGQIHWDVNDTTSPPGPVVPPPAGLWEPAAGITPPSGNYVYLESQAGDWIGAGGIYLYTPADSQITVNLIGATLLGVSVDGDESWNGGFQGMNTLSRLEVGYYGDLQDNPVKGWLNWYGEHRICDGTSGWFVVDNVTYVGVTLTAIELRFEQRCDGSASALRGALRWSQ
jgi:hypothetical protein